MWGQGVKGQWHIVHCPPSDTLRLGEIQNLSRIRHLLKTSESYLDVRGPSSSKLGKNHLLSIEMFLIEKRRKVQGKETWVLNNQIQTSSDSGFPSWNYIIRLVTEAVETR